MKARRKAISTTKQDIIDANIDLLSELDISPDEYSIRCWGCGAEHGDELKRAHIIARANKGDDAPGNFFLLCHICHQEQPDSMSVDVQVAWLKSRETQISRLTREVYPICEELAAVAGNRVDILRDWMADVDGISNRSKSIGTAGASIRTRISNAMWFMVEDLRRFVASRSGGVDP